MPVCTPVPTASPATLDQLPVADLQRVGPRVQERLARLGIHSVQDLLFHLPVRYQDRTRVVPLAELQVGTEVQVEGEVREAQVSQGRRRSLKVWLRDGSRQPLIGGDQGASPEVLLRFFHFSSQQLVSLRPGVRLRCYGEVRQGPNGLELVHPEYRQEVEASAGCAVSERSGVSPRLTPFYPSTAGLQQSTWRGLTDQALDYLERLAPAEYLPAAVIAGLQLPDLCSALVYLHRPPLEVSLTDLTERRHPAFRRLAFEELVAHQVSLRRLRLTHARLRAPALDQHGVFAQRLRETLPFVLTPDQEQAAAEIAADLARPLPMQRLLQGDVGSGKTVVAALAALQAIESGRQAALMAPTELLSEQHWRGLTNWLKPLGVAPAWLTGRHKGRERSGILAAIAAGRAPLVVGTHALIQEEVRFADLGLAIIDEQHRFGVHQRLRLREKGTSGGGVPHQLIMTATPIPRSLAMTLYADLDLSVIANPPPGRAPIVTVAVPDERRAVVIDRVHDACAAGRQAYWVCTLIEESEDLQAQAAEATARQLGEALPGVRVGLVHGRLRAPERESVMTAFAAGTLDLLVATTVIEVGVDVPNASLMIIENPERLGLSQLHQLRGRVGRGAVESHCVLLYRAPLSAQARDRLALIRSTLDGFRIAEEDLRMRGAGEVLGTRQTGALEFRVADPVRDQSLIPAAQRAADLILTSHPELVEPLIQRWQGQRDALGVV
jgi:ATP-dependent DNA helicase RecG